MTELNIDGIKHLSGPILITGHTGFKGTWLTMLLESLDIEIIGVSLPPTEDSLFTQSKRVGRIHEEFFDIRDLKKLENFVHTVKPSAIFHLAAKPLVIDSYLEPRDTFEVNLMGTVNLLDIAQRVDSLRVIICASTDKVYRNINNGQRFIETDPLEAKDPYSASKVATEAAINAWHHLPKLETRERAKVVSVRAGNVIGGGDLSGNRLIPDLIRSVRNQTPAIIRYPNSTRPWQHVIDPLIGYIKLLENTLGGTYVRAMNFSTNEASLTVSEVSNLASRYWPQIEYTIAGDLNISTQFESALLELDPSLAKLTIGWEALWTQEQAIEKTLLWWKNVINHKVTPEEACRIDIEAALQYGRS